MRWLRLLPIPVILIACGGSTALTVPGTTGPATTTATVTTASVSTTAAPATTTEAPAPTAPVTGALYVIESAGLFPPPPLQGSLGASGSGCVPDSTTTVPDGVWYGYVLQTTGASITFDMACWFWGDAATSEAARDGQEVANGYYVRNRNPLTYDVPLHPDAVMYWLDPSSGAFVPRPMLMAEWPGPDEEWPCPGELCGVWVYVNGGAITEAIEQYRP